MTRTPEQPGPTETDRDPAAARIREQQHTGNHDRPPAEKEGNERFGGTRKGAENVEPGKPG